MTLQCLLNKGRFSDTSPPTEAGKEPTPAVQNNLQLPKLLFSAVETPNHGDFGNLIKIKLL